MCIFCSAHGKRSKWLGFFFLCLNASALSSKVPVASEDFSSCTRYKNRTIRFKYHLWNFYIFFYRSVHTLVCGWIYAAVSQQLNVLKGFVWFNCFSKSCSIPFSSFYQWYWMSSSFRLTQDSSRLLTVWSAICVTHSRTDASFHPVPHILSQGNGSQSSHRGE